MLIVDPPDPPPPALPPPRQFLRDKCTQGLGQEKFEKALDLLQRMQEGDCRITVEGVEYDGNEDDDVRFAGKFFFFV